MRKDLNEINVQISEYIFGVFISICMLIAWGILPIIALIKNEISLEVVVFLFFTVGIGSIYLLIASIIEIIKLNKEKKNVTK